VAFSHNFAADLKDYGHSAWARYASAKPPAKIRDTLIVILRDPICPSRLSDSNPLWGGE
jgi:hypothetical protein